jgi:hypothetical protein
MRDLSRKYPVIIEEFVRFIEPSLAAVLNDPHGLSALIWILGEFGDKIEHAPYIIEYLLDCFSNDLQSNSLVYSLLLAACKLFFKTPGEMQNILGRVFEMILKNYHDVDLRDRAYYFYNLMESDIETAKYIICGEPTLIDYFYSDLDDEFIDQIYSQFNTLSVVYRKPEEKFIKTHLDDDGILNKKNEAHDEIYEEEKLNVSEQYIKPAIPQAMNVNLLGNIENVESKKNNNININAYAVNYSKDSFSLSSLLDEEKYQSLWKNIQYV